MEYNFEKLLVWQKAMQLVREVYSLSKQFPADERFALTDQLRRAVVSIPSNIAEGAGRSTNKDYAHFLAMARGSLYETLTQVRIAIDLGYCKSQSSIESLADEIVRMLGAMLKKFGSIEKSKFRVEVQGESKSRVEVQERIDSPSLESKSKKEKSEPSILRLQLPTSTLPPLRLQLPTSTHLRLPTSTQEMFECLNGRMFE